ncbi:MAG: glycosyltransferase family 4 protein [Pyrinomonadaceae bacterium]
MGPISGADETVVTYATQLAAAGHSPLVLVMYPHARDDQYYLRLRKAGVEVSSIASAGVRTSLGAGRRLASGLLRAFPASQRFVRANAQKVSSGLTGRYFEACRDHFARSGADLIHVVTPDPSAMVMIRAAHAAGLPVIYQELGTPYHPPDFEAYYDRFTTVLPLCAEVAALSPRLAAKCRDTLPRGGRLSVLPIMAEDFLKGHNGHAPRRAPSSDVTFGFAARIEHLKGPLVLVEAFAAVNRRFPDTRLKIVGAGSRKQQAAARARALGVADRCHFPGLYTDTEHKAAFMRSIDVFVLPSLTEGTPNGIVEAMSHGLPVVASAVGGIPDMVTAETALLVPPEDPVALAGALCRLVADSELRARMGRAGRERYDKLFSPAAVMPVMVETYRRIAAGNRVAAGNGAFGASAVSPNGHHESHPWARQPV